LECQAASCRVRERAPRLFIDEDGKERLRIDGKAFGGRKGLGALGAVGARDGVEPATPAALCREWLRSGKFESSPLEGTGAS
jgi:hypothetical protein